MTQSHSMLLFPLLLMFSVLCQGSSVVRVPGRSCGIGTPYRFFNSIGPEDLPLPECSLVKDTKSFRALHRMCSDYSSPGMKLNRKERVVYFLSLSQDTAVEDIPEYCASLEMEILMPKDPAQWVTFKSMFEEELPGNRVGGSLRIPSTVSQCQNEGCDNKLEWVDGTPFKYDERYGQVKIFSSSGCTFFATANFKDHLCHNLKYAACQTPCQLP